MLNQPQMSTKQPIFSTVFNIAAFLFLSTGLLSCYSLSSQAYFFNFNAPDRKIELDSQLIEISGITIFNNDTSLLAIQDESGIVYQISSNTGKIQRQVSFTPKGDFEDIQYAPPFVYVNKSNGTIFQLDDKNFKVLKTFDSGLNKENDIEGMFYSSGTQSLLLSCKGPLEIKPEEFNRRAVFAYDLKKNKLGLAPVFSISKEAINDFISEAKNTSDAEGLRSNYNDKVKEFNFGPSAIAIDPITKNYFVLSSVGKIMLVADQSGKITHIFKLKKDIYPQPEGMAFDSKGNLYISSEGKKGKGSLVFLKRLK